MARVLAVVAICGLCIAAWDWILVTPMNPAQVSAWVEPHRHAWNALPMVMLAFIALGLFPVLLLITATGIAFGPVLGPICAMAGCLASASVGFAIGRWLGVRRVERLGGEWIKRVTRAVHRIALAGFGYQLTQALRNPSPATLGGAALCVGAPLALAWYINRALRRARHAG